MEADCYGVLTIPLDSMPSISPDRSPEFACSGPQGVAGSAWFRACRGRGHCAGASSNAFRRRLTVMISSAWAVNHACIHSVRSKKAKGACPTRRMLMRRTSPLALIKLTSWWIRPGAANPTARPRVISPGGVDLTGDLPRCDGQPPVASMLAKPLILQWINTQSGS